MLMVVLLLTRKFKSEPYITSVESPQDVTPSVNNTSVEHAKKSESDCELDSVVTISNNSDVQCNIPEKEKKVNFDATVKKSDSHSTLQQPRRKERKGLSNGYVPFSQFVKYSAVSSSEQKDTLPNNPNSELAKMNPIAKTETAEKTEVSSKRNGDQETNKTLQLQNQQQPELHNTLDTSINGQNNINEIMPSLSSKSSNASLPNLSDLPSELFLKPLEFPYIS